MPPKRAGGRRGAGRRVVFGSHAATPGSAQFDSPEFQQDSHDTNEIDPLDSCESSDGEAQAHPSPDGDGATIANDNSSSGITPHPEAAPDSENDMAAMEILELSSRYRAKDTLLDVIRGCDCDNHALARYVERPQPAPAGAAADAVLQDHDTVPWLQIMQSARSRAASMVLLKNFILVLVFTCVYLFALGMQVQAFESFQVSGAMRGLLADAQAQTSRGEMKGLFDIKSYQDWYEWADIVLVPQFYGTSEQDYNGRPFTGRMRHMLNWQNRICGGIAILQQRSQKEPCIISGAGSTLSEQCTDDDWGDLEPYGQCHAGIFKVCTADNKFGTGLNFSAILPRSFGSALKASFYVQLGPDESSARAQLLALQQGNWIDSRTRRIQVFVTVWNFNMNILQSHEMTVVFYAGGLSRVFFTERHTSTEHYNIADSKQLLRVVLEVVSAAFLVYFWADVIGMVYFSWRGRFFSIHFKSGWTIVDMLHCAFMSAAAILWIVFVVSLPRQHLLPLIDADDDVAALNGLALMDYFPLYDLYVQVSGATIFFNLLKVLKTFQFHSKTAVVVSTIANMAAPLFSFIIGFSVIFFGFVFIAFLNFGTFLMDWHTISFAAGSAVNAIFETMPPANVDHLPSFASFYVYWQFAFVFVVNFVSLNLIVSIIIEGYMLTLERNKIRSYSSQSMLDQFAVAVIEFLCMLFVSVPTIICPFSIRVRQRIQGLGERLSSIFGRRLQVHYCAPQFFLNICDRIDVPQHNNVSFGFIMAEIEKNIVMPGDTTSRRSAVSEVLLHFMENIKSRSNSVQMTGQTLRNTRQQVKDPSNRESRLSDSWKINVQLRDEAVLLLRSHARTLQRHSNLLHNVSV
jgi:hypothetical protein